MVSDDHSISLVSVRSGIAVVTLVGLAWFLRRTLTGRVIVAVTAFTAAAIGRASFGVLALAVLLALGAATGFALTTFSALDGALIARHLPPANLIGPVGQLIDTLVNTLGALANYVAPAIILMTVTATVPVGGRPRGEFQVDVVLILLGELPQDPEAARALGSCRARGFGLSPGCCPVL